MDFHVKLERQKSFNANIEKPKESRVSLGKEIINKIEQKQVDLAQNDASQVDYIKNKSTKHLLNEGNDGTSPYVTEKDIKQITDSLEKLNQNKVENTTTINGYDLSGNIELRAEDINAIPNTIKYAASLDLSIDSSTYVMTAQLKDQNGNFIGNSQSIDLPLESVVVNGFLDEEKDEVVLVLKNGNEIRFGITDITNGLVGKTELDKTNNKLSDLENKLANIEDKNGEQDTTIANLNNDKADKSKIPTKVSQLENDEKFLKDYTETDPTVPSHVKNITANNISSWNSKQDAINDLSTIRSGASLGTTAVQPSSLGTLASKNSVDYTTEVTNKPTIPTVNDATVLITQGGNFKGSFTLNQPNGVAIDLDAGGSGEDNSITIDDYLSETSTNPVQNKVINSALSNVTQNMNLLNTHKANSDATNLTELNIAAWKEKLQLGLPLGMIIPSAIVQNDSALHLLDGSPLTLDGMYKEFCDYLVQRYTQDSSSVPVCTIQEYANDMNDYGQCGKFVYNAGSSIVMSTPRNGTYDLTYSIPANSLKLPTITEFIASNNGGLVLGLAQLDSFKSHTHTITKSHPFNTSASGNYSSGTSVDGENTANKVTTTELTGGDETKPKNVRYPYYIVVATVTKTDVEVNIDNVASDLNNISNQVQNKAQSDLSNVANSVLKNKAFGLTTLWEGSQTGTGTLSLAQSFLNFNFLYVLGRNSNSEYCTGVITTSIFNNTSNTYPYGFANNSKDSNRFVNLYKASNTSITIKSIGSMTLLGVYGL